MTKHFSKHKLKTEPTETHKSTKRTNEKTKRIKNYNQKKKISINREYIYVVDLAKGWFNFI